VIYTVLCGYLLGWVMTTIGLALTIRKVNDRVRPQPHPIPLAVAAGAAWPLVILGAAEMAAVAIVVQAARRRTSRFPIRATPPADRPRRVDHSNRQCVRRRTTSPPVSLGTSADAGDRETSWDAPLQGSPRLDVR
jgi:hypothetical protein